MALASWGAIEKNGDIANPNVGEASMWMLIVSQESSRIILSC